MPEIFRLGAELIIPLDVDALHAPLIDEIVDVATAPRGRESGVHVGIGEPVSAQPLRIDVDLQGGDIGQISQAHLGELGIAAGEFQQFVARSHELVAAHPAAVLELHVEAGRIAQALYRSGDEDEDLRIANATQRHSGPLGDGIGRVFLARPIVPWLEVDIALAGILPRCRLRPAACHQEQRVDVLLLVSVEIFRHFIAYFQRPFARGAGGQAELQQDASLVFGWQEPTGKAQEQHRQQTGNQCVNQQ